MITDLFFNLCTLFGYGNPAAKFWFVGMEDGGNGWNKNSRKDIETLGPVCLPERFYPMPEKKIRDEIYNFDKITGKNHGTKIYHSFSHIISRGATDYTNWKKYLFNSAHENTYFQMNLYPLGRPQNESWPAGYEELFGIGDSSIDQEAYESWITTVRLRLLRAFWAEHCHRKVTICFGEGEDGSYWEKDRLLFGLSGNGDLLNNRPKVIYYHEQKVVLTPFFGNGRISVKDREAVIEKVNEILG
ncbi:MAG: hypothetical protein WCJ02_17175 [bacterium]